MDSTGILPGVKKYKLIFKLNLQDLHQLQTVLKDRKIDHGYRHIL